MTVLRRRELLGWLAAATVPASSSRSEVSPSSPSSPLVDELFGKRLMFGGSGQPLVPLGMMQGQKRVVLRSGGGLVVTVDGVTVEVPKDTPVVVDRMAGTAGVVRELQVLETLEGPDRSRRRPAIEAWKKRGLTVAAYDVGGVYGVKGTVVDNRAVLIAHDGPLPAGFEDTRPVPIEWLDSVPRATFRAATPTSSRLSPRLCCSMSAGSCLPNPSSASTPSPSACRQSHPPLRPLGPMPPKR